MINILQIDNESSIFFALIFMTPCVKIGLQINSLFFNRGFIHLVIIVLYWD